MRSAFLRPPCGTSATLRDVERPLATAGTHEEALVFDIERRHGLNLVLSQFKGDWQYQAVSPLLTLCMLLFYYLFNNFAEICAGKEYFLVPLHPEKRKKTERKTKWKQQQYCFCTALTNRASSRK